MTREAIQTSLPDLAILLQPVGHIPQRRALQPRRTPLRRPPARDQPGPLEYLQVLGDGLRAERERLCQLVHGALAVLREPRKDRPPRRVGEGREGGAER